MKRIGMGLLAVVLVLLTGALAAPAWGQSEGKTLRTVDIAIEGMT